MNLIVEKFSENGFDAEMVEMNIIGGRKAYACIIFWKGTMVRFVPASSGDDKAFIRKIAVMRMEEMEVTDLDENRFLCKGFIYNKTIQRNDKSTRQSDHRLGSRNPETI